MVFVLIYALWLTENSAMTHQLKTTEIINEDTIHMTQNCTLNTQKLKYKPVLLNFDDKINKYLCITYK